MPLPGTLAALELRPQLHREHEPAGGGINHATCIPKTDKRRAVEHCLDAFGGQRRGGRRRQTPHPRPVPNLDRLGRCLAQHRRTEIKQTGGAQFVEPGNSVRSSSPKCARRPGRGPVERPAGAVAPPARHPADFHAGRVPRASVTPRIASISRR
jgi:hypothetical protein